MPYQHPEKFKNVRMRKDLYRTLSRVARQNKRTIMAQLDLVVSGYLSKALVEAPLIRADQ